MLFIGSRSWLISVCLPVLLTIRIPNNVFRYLCKVIGDNKLMHTDDAHDAYIKGTHITLAHKDFDNRNL